MNCIWLQLQGNIETRGFKTGLNLKMYIYILCYKTWNIRWIWKQYMQLDINVIKLSVFSLLY